MTEVTFTTVTVANVIVWVDENGVPIETTTVSELPSVPSSTIDATTTTSSSVMTTSNATPAKPTIEDVPDPTSTYSVSPPPYEAPPSVSLEIKPVATSESVTTTTAAPSTSAAPSSQADELTPVVVPSAIFTSATSVSTVDGDFVLFTSTSTLSSPGYTSAVVDTSSSSSPSASASAAAEPGPKAAESDDRFPIGVTYDPFTPGGCKSEEEIRRDWEGMKQFGTVRLYGIGCNLVPVAVGLAHENKQTIFAGAWLSNGADNEPQDDVIRTYADAVKNKADGDWNVIAAFSVENERVNDKVLTGSAVVEAILTAREKLRALGYKGPVGAVETVPAMVGNPSICEAADIAMVNAHAFFDTNAAAEDAGQFVQGQVDLVKKACNKRVVVTETGWPHQGDLHDKAFPSRENQKKAIESLRSKFEGDLYLFNAYDSPWKSDWQGSFNAEKFWGIL